jgi:hypothetical protein
MHWMPRYCNGEDALHPLQREMYMFFPRAALYLQTFQRDKVPPVCLLPAPSVECLCRHHHL